MTKTKLRQLVYIQGMLKLKEKLLEPLIQNIFRISGTLSKSLSIIPKPVYFRCMKSSMPCSLGTSCFESISKTHNAQILKILFESFDQLNTLGAMIDGCEFPKQRSLETNLHQNGKQRKHIQY